jgi:5-bromo-4-chloroindolyl phosphate hydrolysis protein
MDKYDVYEILYRGFMFCAITIGMLYFVMMITNALSGLVGLIITGILYALWFMVVVGTGAYLLIIMNGTFRPKAPDSIDDLIEELEDDEDPDLTETRIKEIIASIKVTELLKGGSVSNQDYERIRYAMELAGERIEQLEKSKGEKSND